MFKMISDKKYFFKVSLPDIFPKSTVGGIALAAKFEHFAKNHNLMSSGHFLEIINGRHQG